MSFDLAQLTLISVGYLLILFSCAWLTDRGWVSRKLVSHPVIYVLSLGVYASAWAFYGAVGQAFEFGFVFLAYYLGICGAFLLAPVLLSPILRITRSHQLSSLADLLSFRFRSTWAGSATTVIMLLAVMPLLAMQIQSVADAIHILTQEGSQETLAFGFCALITVFAMAFGTRQISAREKHHGLVLAIALESLIKLITIFILGGVILFQVFDGPQDMQSWLTSNQYTLNAMRTPLADGPWRTLLLMFFAAAVVMPDMFHMTFAEGQEQRNLNIASWGLPLYLLLISMPVPLILWGGLRLGVTTVPEYYMLGIGLELELPWLSILTYIGGMAAASGLIIVTTLALSSMILNHLVLPVYQPPANVSIYRWLKWTKRFLIAALILSSYGFYQILEAKHDLTSLAIVAFVATLQFLPGVLATLYWPDANHKGFISGLVVGVVLWFVTLLMPLVAELDYINLIWVQLPLTIDTWHWAALLALGANVAIFILISSTTQTSFEEQNAAELCSLEHLSRPRRQLIATSPREFQERLAVALGSETARREVAQAMADLNMLLDESRPFALRRLRDQIEANLSGLMGPSVTREIITRYLPYAHDGTTTADLHLMENRIEQYQHRLTGLAAELDSLRRYHRQTLQHLPMAVCSLNGDSEIQMWNQAMEKITGIVASNVTGSRLSGLEEPWQGLLQSFINDTGDHQTKQQLTIKGQSRCFNLHKADIDKAVTGSNGLVILLEEQTETQQLEQKLIHSERLASIGRLAAGVAHEIGNPVTGIDCLAQELQSLSEDPDTREIAGQIHGQTKRIGKILHSLVNFAHTGQATEPSMIIESVSLHECSNEVISLLSLNKDKNGIRFVNNCDPEHLVTGDNQKLTQVLINLLDNARDASPDHALVTVYTSATEHTVYLEITDDGPGIPDEIHEQLFEPFFTTKEAGKGTGLGLALVYSIIEEHFGTISIRSPVSASSKRGTCFTISLPRHIEELHNNSRNQLNEPVSV